MAYERLKACLRVHAREKEDAMAQTVTASIPLHDLPPPRVLEELSSQIGSKASTAINELSEHARALPLAGKCRPGRHELFPLRGIDLWVRKAEITHRIHNRRFDKKASEPLVVGWHDEPLGVL